MMQRKHTRERRCDSTSTSTTIVTTTSAPLKHGMLIGIMMIRWWTVREQAHLPLLCESNPELPLAYALVAPRGRLTCGGEVVCERSSEVGHCDHPGGVGVVCSNQQPLSTAVGEQAFLAYRQKRAGTVNSWNSPRPPKCASSHHDNHRAVTWQRCPWLWVTEHFEREVEVSPVDVSIGPSLRVVEHEEPGAPVLHHVQVDPS